MLSLAAYAEQSVRVEFNATTDSSLPSSLFIDDLSLATGNAALAPASGVMKNRTLAAR